MIEQIDLVNPQLVEAIELCDKSNWDGLLELLIDQPEIAKKSDNLDETILDYTCIDAPLKVLDMLVSQGADIHHLDSEGMGILHIFVIQRNPPIDKINWFLSKGGNPNQKTRLGWAPLHLVAEKGMPEVAKILIQAGAEIDSRTELDWRKRTPLMIAAHSNNVDVALTLLQAGANPLLKDNRKKTVFEYVNFFSGKQMKKLLIKWCHDRNP